MFLATEDHSYPRLIIGTRHGGAYEHDLNGNPATWAAFPCDPDSLPMDATGDDAEYRSWWSNPTMAVGAGKSPNDALAELELVVSRCDHPLYLRFDVPAGFVCGFCGQLVKRSP